MKPSPNRFLASLLAGFCLWSCQPDSVSGTSDEHETSLARLYLPSGAPAARAAVSFFAVGDSSQLPAARTYTADNGAIEVPVLPAGMYNAVATNGTQAVLMDSIVFSANGQASLLSDTLRPLCVVTGRLRVEPQHSPQIGWVQVLGQGLAANVDAQGNFRLALPGGRGVLAGYTRAENYTPTFRTVELRGGDSVDIGDLRLVYTALPVVTGLNAAYDDKTGIVTVRWDKDLSGKAMGYRLLRGTGLVWMDSLDLYSPADTVWYDTVYRADQEDRQDQDSTYHQYTVKIVDSNGVMGPQWRVSRSMAVSPFHVQRLPLVWDSLGKLPDGCTELDSVAGGLACLQYRRAGSFWTFGAQQYDNGLSYGSFPDNFREADSLFLWTSVDGRSWSSLGLIATNVMRAVFWQGRLWTIQGGISGDSAAEKPSYSSAVVCSFELDGRVSSRLILTTSTPRQGFRIAVRKGRLLASGDEFAVNSYSNLPGPRPIASEVWEIEGMKSSVVEASSYPEDGFELTWSVLGMIPVSRFITMPSFAPPLTGTPYHGVHVIQGLFHSYLFFKSPDSPFPWKGRPSGHPILSRWRYRGSSEELSNGIPWGSAMLYPDLNGNLWSMSVKE